MSATARLNGLKQSLSTFWSERNQRERNMLTAAIVVVVLGLFYTLLLDPALTGRVEMDKRLPALRQQAAEVRALAKEAAATGANRPAAAPPRMTREMLETSLSRNGLKAQNLSVTGELAKVQLSGVSFAATVDWLSELQKTARVTVAEAVVDAQEQPDTVNANLTLRQQGVQAE